MEKEEVEKRNLIYEVEDEIWRLIKRRAWLVALVGIGGIWALVNFTVARVADGPLERLKRELLRAEVQADQAKRAGETATSAADSVSTNLQSLQKVIEDLQGQAESVTKQFGVVSQQIDAVSRNAELRSERDFSAIQRRISALEELVKKASAENAATRKAAALYAAQVATLEKKFEKEQKQFAENSAFRVVIYAVPEKKNVAAEVSKRLAAVGFRASYVEFPWAAEKTVLSYPKEGEGKAREIASLAKPLLPNIDLQQQPDISALQSMFTTKGLKFETADVPGTKYLGAWGFESNNFVLSISK